MKEWLDTGIYQVGALLERDADFQSLLHQLENARVGYNEAISALSEQHREQVGDYIALCEEVEYQKTLTAYYCGKRNG